MKITMRVAASAAFAAIALAAPALAADAVRGKQLYSACVACHGDAQHKPTLGPSLVGVFGRKAGQLDDFRYSPAMQRSNLVWSDDTLRQYIMNPQKLVKGNRMPFTGLRDEADASDVVAYLHTLQ